MVSGGVVRGQNGKGLRCWLRCGLLDGCRLRSPRSRVVIVNCPSCKKQSGVPDDAVGKNVQCSACPQVFIATPATPRPGPLPLPPPEDDVPRKPAWPLVSSILHLVIWGLVAAIIFVSAVEFMIALSRPVNDAIAALFGISARIFILYVIARCGEKLLAAVDRLMGVMRARAKD